MHSLSWLALIFLTLFGYSAGGVLGRRTQPRGKTAGVQPTLLDTALVIVLWMGAIACRLTTDISPWRVVAIGFIVALGVAFVLNCFQRPSHDGNTLLQ